VKEYAVKYLIPEPLVPVVQRLRWFPYLVAYRVMCWVKPVRSTGVVFISGVGSHLSGNLRSIREAMGDEFHTWEFFPSSWGGFLQKMSERYRLVVAVAQAKYVLMDDYLHLIHALKIRRGTQVVQVWHGLGAMKKMGFSREGRGSNAPPATSLIHRNYTDVVVSSDQMRPHYSQAFRVPLEKIHGWGSPRSDLFFDEEAMDEVRRLVWESVPALKDRRVLVFAPTYRVLADGSFGYEAEFLDLVRMGEALGEKDLLVLKFHPFVRRPWEIPPSCADKIIDMSTYPEFNHVLVVTDLLITDYSSAIFDYALMDKPVLFYTPDLDTYDGARGFYYPFETYTYGPVVSDQDALIAHLDTTKIDKKKRENFCELFLDGCDGQATSRFMKEIFDVPPATRRTLDMTGGGR